MVTYNSLGLIIYIFISGLGGLINQEALRPKGLIT